MKTMLDGLGDLIDTNKKTSFNVTRIRVRACLPVTNKTDAMTLFADPLVVEVLSSEFAGAPVSVNLTSH